MSTSRIRIALVAVVLSASAADAQLAGTLNFSGTMRLSGIDPVNTAVDFDPFGNSIGFVTISSGGNTGSFAIFNTTPPTPPQFGTIRDVTLGAGGAYNVPAFVQVPVAPL